ncbi:hypothetical protein VQ056_30155 [Paenibacillus sp. JTLBN-2024]
MNPTRRSPTKRGEYAFKGVVPGRYKLYLGVNASQLNGWTWPEQRDGGWIDLNGQQAAVEERYVSAAARTPGTREQCHRKGKQHCLCLGAGSGSGVL